MAFLSPAEVLRVGMPRHELLSKLTQLMALAESKLGRKTFIPDKGGVRSTAVQAAIHADSLASNFRAAPAGQSFHQFGAAFDLQFVGTEQDPERDQKDPAYEQLARLGESIGLRAGKHFRTGRPDPYHFELSETIAESRAKWAELTKERLWRAAIVAVVAVVVMGAAYWLYFRPRRGRSS